MAISGNSISKSFIFRHLFLILVIIGLGVGYYFYYYVNDKKQDRIIDVANLKLDKNSPNYINDLYISDGRHYQYVLSDIEKEIYQTLLEATKKYQSKVTIDLTDSKYEDFYFSGIELEKIQEVMIMDHPELLQLGYFKLFDEDDSDNKKRQFQVEIRYAFKKAQYNTVYKKVKQILEKARKETTTMNDYEKAKYVYDWIGNKASYDNTVLPELRSAYNAMIVGKANSTGYAKAAQLMLQYIKVNSILVSGTFKNNGYEWNLIRIDGKYYHFDATATYKYKAKAGIVYTGLLFRNSPDYKFEYPDMIPRVNGKEYEYYSYNKLIYEYDGKIEKLGKILNESKSKVVQLKVKNYSQFYREASIAKAELDFEAIYFVNEVAIIVKK